LSIEMQLYALYPLIFFLIQKRGMNPALLLTLAASMVCLALGCLPWFRSLTWFGPYWFCWVLGCAVAELENANQWISPGRGKIIVWCLVSILGFGLWLSPFNKFAFSCVGCFWALILLKCLQPRAARSFFPPLAWLAKIGVISYSLYAVHVPFCLLIRSLFLDGKKSDDILVVLPVIGGCVLVAAGLFFAVERHCLRVPNWLKFS